MKINLYKAHYADFEEIEGFLIQNEFSFFIIIQKYIRFVDKYLNYKYIQLLEKRNLDDR